MVVDKVDNGWSDQPYPEGGACGGSGSTSVDRGAIRKEAPLLLPSHVIALLSHVIRSLILSSTLLPRIRRGGT